MYKYYILNKPFGTLSQFTREHPSHQVLADHYSFPKDVYPIGRLDRDSEGLLLLSNDKKLVKSLLSPESKVWKTYWVQVEGIPEEKSLELLRQGIEIRVNKKRHKCKPAKVRRFSDPPNIWDRDPPIRVRKNIPDSWLEIKIQEGKNRQIRRMFATIGFPVMRVNEFAIRRHTLAEMNPGQGKELKKLEV